MNFQVLPLAPIGSLEAMEDNESDWPGCRSMMEKINVFSFALTDSIIATKRNS